MEVYLIFIIILLIAILVCVYGNGNISMSYDTELELHRTLNIIEHLLEEVNKELSHILDELRTQRFKREQNPDWEDWAQ